MSGLLDFILFNAVVDDIEDDCKSSDDDNDLEDSEK